jgi:hypothetical protein
MAPIQSLQEEVMSNDNGCLGIFVGLVFIGAAWKLLSHIETSTSETLRFLMIFGALILFAVGFFLVMTGMFDNGPTPHD